MGIRLYISNVLIGFDEFVNTLAGGAPGDTISGRAGRARNDGRKWGIVLCTVLDWIQPQH
jgi:hypothetical protein